MTEQELQTISTRLYESGALMGKISIEPYRHGGAGFSLYIRFTPNQDPMWFADMPLFSTGGYELPAFVAHAAEDVAALIQEVLRLQTRVEDLESNAVK